MPTLDYYRRQALASLNHARAATNPETKRQLIELAYQLMARAAAEDELNEFAQPFGRRYVPATRVIPVRPRSTPAANIEG